MYLAGRWLVWLGVGHVRDQHHFCLFAIWGRSLYPCHMSFTVRSTFSVTLAVCMTCILETQNYWSISLPSPLMEADFAFVKEMYCAWTTMCMQVCSWMFPFWMCILIYAVWELQWTVMRHETYVVTYTVCTKAQSHFSALSYFHLLLLLNWSVHKKI